MLLRTVVVAAILPSHLPASIAIDLAVQTMFDAGRPDAEPLPKSLARTLVTSMQGRGARIVAKYEIARQAEALPHAEFKELALGMLAEAVPLFQRMQDEQRGAFRALILSIQDSVRDKGVRNGTAWLPGILLPEVVLAKLDL